MVKNPPANAGDTELWVRSLGRKDPLEKEMAAPSSILAWEIPRTEEPGGLQSMGHEESDKTERLSTLLTTVTMLYIRSPEFIHLIMNFYTFKNSYCKQ